MSFVTTGTEADAVAAAHGATAARSARATGRRADMATTVPNIPTGAKAPRD